MKAEILAVGSELLNPLRTETNAVYMTARLLEVGVAVGARSTIGDDPAWLQSAFAGALSRADIVLSSGGLGPTEDDVTREAAAAALGRGLRRDARILAQLEELFARFDKVMAPVNAKQADVIEGASVLPNARGTAPGQMLAAEGKLLVLLPGPPAELKAMFDQQVLPHLRSRAGGRLFRSRVLRIAGMSESDVEELVAPVYRAFSNPSTTILGSPGQVELHLTAVGDSEAAAQARLDELGAALRERLKGRIYSEDGRELPAVVGALLRDSGYSLALAESCTGGQIAARLTDVPGASAFLERAYVTYSDASKSALLDVSPELIRTHGAVSEPVARAMARGACARAGTDLAIAVTGIAGPSGATPEKPVGTVYVALTGALGENVKPLLLAGDRRQVRHQASQAALELLRRRLAEKQR